MTATKPTAARIAILVVGAMLSAMVSFQATLLVLVISGDQMVVDPATHQVSFEPWWAIFGNSDRVPVLGLFVAALGFGWLTWDLCRRAFPRRLRKHDYALKPTAGASRIL